MSLLETFNLAAKGLGVTDEQLPMAREMLKHFQACANMAVDGCIELVRKWGEVKQLTANDDFKLLLEYMEKQKEDMA